MKRRHFSAILCTLEVERRSASGPQISPFHRSGLRGPSSSLAFKLKCNCVLSRIKPPACWERSTCQPGWWYCEDTDAAQCPWNSMHFHVNGTAQDLYLNSDLFMLTRGHENACTLLILGQLRTCKTFWFFGGTITHYPVHCSDQVYLQSSALWFTTQCQCCPMWFLCHQPKSFVFDFWLQSRAWQ